MTQQPQTTSTRAFVREAFPVILATGRNPSIQEVKAYVRAAYPGLEAWNPSDSTVSSELQAIRKSLGEQLVSDQGIPGLPEAVANALAGAGAQIMQIARGAAEKALEEEKAEAAQKIVDARYLATTARQAAEQAEAALSNARHGFETSEARLIAERDSAQALAADKTTLAATLQGQVERLTAGMEDRAGEIASLRATLENQAAQMTEQLTLAESRYRDLERAKLTELDQARTQRDKAVREMGDWKKTFEAARQDALAARKETVKSQELLNKSLASINQLRTEIAKREMRAVRIPKRNPGVVRKLRNVR